MVDVWIWRSFVGLEVVVFTRDGEVFVTIFDVYIGLVYGFY